jgi:hypothetical protein
MAIASGAEPAQVHTSTARVTFAAVGTRHARLSRLPVSVGAALLVLVGTVTQLIALISATWWQATVGDRQVAFGFTDFAPRAWRGFAYIYFTWGAWLIVGVSLGLGVASCVRWRGARIFRFVGAAFGVAAIIAPIAALLVFAYQSDGDLFHVVRDYGVGPYLAVLGAMASTLGAAAGPGR